MKNISKVKIFFSVLTLTSATLVMFQNCGAPSHTMQVTELSSYHSDENHWEKPKIKTNYTTNLADRHYVLSILEDVFGPTAMNVDNSSVGSQISSRLVEFGTPCSVYEDYRIPGTSTYVVSAVRARAEHGCSFGDRSDGVNASIISSATANREGYIINTCTALVENPTTRNYALAKINGGAFNGTAPAVTRQKLINLYVHFYRSRPSPSPGVLDSLELIFQYEPDLVKAWKAAIYSVCASDQWQVL